MDPSIWNSPWGKAIWYNHEWKHKKETYMGLRSMGSLTFWEKKGKNLEKGIRTLGFSVMAIR